MKTLKDSGRCLTRPIYLPLTLLALSLIALPWAMTRRDSGSAGTASNLPTRLTEAGNAPRARLSEAYGKLPLSFEANQGQVNQPVKFLSRGSGYNLFLTPAEAVLTLSRPAAEGEDTAALHQAVLRPSPQARAAVRMRLMGANRQPRISGLGELPGKTNYFLGHDPKQWRRDVPTYRQVKYEQVYPGVDVVYYGNQQQLEYDFIVAPGADPKAIRLAFAGAERLRLDERGDLILETGAGELRQLRPAVYQEVSGAKQGVAGRYVIRGKNEIGFEVGEYDASQPLVIDPVLGYSTFLSTMNAGIAVDATGHAYVVGSAFIMMPTTPGVPRPTQTNPPGLLEKTTFVHVTKLNPQGTGIIYSALFGGTDAVKVISHLPGSDGEVGYSLGNRGTAIALDAAGNAYVTGMTVSTNFPTTPGAFRTSYETNDGNYGVFVTKLNADGTQLLASTLLGAGSAYGLAVDNSGNAYVTGSADQSYRDFPSTPGVFQPAINPGKLGTGSIDAFVTKVSADGTRLIYSTFLGSGGTDRGWGIAVDAVGNAYVTGETTNGRTGGGTPDGDRFPTTPGAFKTNDDTFSGAGAFVSKLSADGSKLLYSTILTGGSAAGHSDSQAKLAIAIDAAGYAYVAGTTDYADFPTTRGAYQTQGGRDNTAINNDDVFVTKLAPDGSALAYSTFIGAFKIAETADGIAVDAAGNAYVVGRGYGGVLVVKLNPAGNALLYSLSFFGGMGRGIAVDAAGNAYITGIGSDVPTTPGAFAGQPTGGFVMKISESGGFPIPPLPPIPDPDPPERVTIGGRIKDQNGKPMAGVKILLQSSILLGDPDFPKTTGTIFTSSAGYYVWSGLPFSGTYTVTPSQEGYVSAPLSRTFNTLAWHETVNFVLSPLAGPTPTPTTYTISGRVTDRNGKAIQGVSLSGAQTGNAVTDRFGLYSFSNLPRGGNYTVTPPSTGIAVGFKTYYASPGSASFTNLSSNQVANFAYTSTVSLATAPAPTPTPTPEVTPTPTPTPSPSPSPTLRRCGFKPCPKS